VKTPPVTPHPMTDDGTGVCATCHIHDPDRLNARHHMPDNPAQAAHRARVGEREDD
jgi:hypothetical protein